MVMAAAGVPRRWLIAPLSLVAARCAVRSTVAAVTPMPAVSGVHQDEEQEDGDPKPVISKPFHMMIPYKIASPGLTAPAFDRLLRQCRLGRPIVNRGIIRWGRRQRAGDRQS